MTVPEPRNFTVAQLAALNTKTYMAELRVRLRRDDYWPVLLDPVLIERTRYCLSKIISSIDAQRSTADTTDPDYLRWLRGVNALQRWSRERLEALPPAALSDIPIVSGSREARAWRGLAVKLAEELERSHPDALERYTTPWGNLNMLEWLAARRAKEQADVR